VEPIDVAGRWLRRSAAHGIWFRDTVREVLTRFASGSATVLRPVRTPDGSFIVFSMSPTGVFDLYQKATTGTGAEEPLLTSPESRMASDFSLDDRLLLYRTFGRRTEPDIWAPPLKGDRKPFAVVQTTADERDRISLLTADGSRISPTSRDVLRSTFSHFQVLDRKNGSRAMAACRYAGAATAGNCSSSGWMTG
jgi:hypothetical protein